MGVRTGELQIPPQARWARVAPENGDSLSAQEEQEILRACQAGDWSGYGLLVQRYRRLVWAAVDAIGLDSSQTEDVVQGAFIRAYEKLGSFRFESSFSSWLWRLARNHALSCLRSTRRRPRLLSLEGLTEKTGAAVARLTGLPGAARDGTAAASVPLSGDGCALNPEVQYAQTARESALREMLLALPADQREALNLYYVADYSYEQIAAALRLPLNTVRTKLHRGRQRLMQLASERGWESN